MIFGFFLSFSRFFISLLPVMSYMSLSSQEKPLLQQIIPRHLFTLFMLSYAPYKHYFSKYWGDGCMGHPHLRFFGGTVPIVPLGLRPCSIRHPISAHPDFIDVSVQRNSLTISIRMNKIIAY